MAPKLIFVFKDGTELESSYDAPYSIREQLDWEEHFRSSFSAIEAAFDAARQARSGGVLDPERSLRTTWLLWFGWHRARSKVPARFEAFIDTLEDWRVEAEPVEDAGEAAPGGEPERDAGDEAAAEMDGRLDPTRTTEPSASVP